MTMGVIVGVAVIVTMVSFGLGLQRNMLARFKALDLFNEINVFGRGLGNLAAGGFDRNAPRNTGDGGGERRGPRFRPDKNPTRILDDAGVAEIAKIPGVAYVEPNISFPVYVRTNGKALLRTVAGATVPNSSSRFQLFSAGKMIGSPDADEGVVNEAFTKDFGFAKPADAIGQTIEFLTAENPGELQPGPRAVLKLKSSRPASLEYRWKMSRRATESPGLVAHTFRIVGVLDTEVKEGAGQGGFRGLMPPSSVYIPLKTARQWALTHRGPISQVTWRWPGRVAPGRRRVEGYDSAIIRVPIRSVNRGAKATDGTGFRQLLDRRSDGADPHALSDYRLCTRFVRRHIASGGFVWHRQYDDHVDSGADARDWHHEGNWRRRPRDQIDLLCRSRGDRPFGWRARYFARVAD